MGRRTIDPIVLFAHKLRDAHKLLSATELDPDCVVIESAIKLPELAETCSLCLPGKWVSLPYGVCNIRGRRVQWLLTKGQVKAVLSARALAKAVTGEPHGWSVASNAKHMLKWAVMPYKERNRKEAVMGAYEFGYHSCKPGEYPEMELLDMKHCYWQLLQRMPTLRFHWTSSTKFVEGRLLNDEQARLRVIFDALEEEEEMRRAAWGAALGSVDPQRFWLEGVQCTGTPYPGPFHTAALLVARMACELTQTQAIELDAVYSQTDGVIVPRYSRPRIWERHDMQFRVKKRGLADIWCQHSYDVGGFPTIPYQNGMKIRDSQPHLPVPKTLYIQRYL